MPSTMAFQFPRPCPYDGTMMDRIENGVRCATCTHTIFDPFEQGVACTCEKCKAKNATA